jgi:hypothetical protein
MGIPKAARSTPLHQLAELEGTGQVIRINSANEPTQKFLRKPTPIVFTKRPPPFMDISFYYNKELPENNMYGTVKNWRSIPIFNST